MHLDGIKKGNFERIKTDALSAELNIGKRRFGEAFLYLASKCFDWAISIPVKIHGGWKRLTPPRNIGITCIGKKNRSPVNILTGAEKSPIHPLPENWKQTLYFTELRKILWPKWKLRFPTFSPNGKKIKLTGRKTNFPLSAWEEYAAKLKILQPSFPT